MAEGYAGDVTVQEAWDLLLENPKAQLVDVRSRAEWSFIGLPLLDTLNRKPLCVELLSFPGMVRNENFLDQLQEALDQSGSSKDTPLVFLCRSGGRSKNAAMIATGLGYEAAFNIAGGFEGDLDQEGHRNSVNGWRASGLPWVQS